MIKAGALTKRYNDKLAVAGLTFTVQPGRVTRFLVPNGAGKSTTMRMIVGVGVLLEARATHTGRSARNHLLAMAATEGISRSRVDDVIGMVGLGDVAGRRTGAFSLGMGQRFGSGFGFAG